MFTQRVLWRLTAAAAIAGAALAACGDDEGATGAGAAGPTTTTASGGAGGESATTTSTGAGAGSNLVCNHDGRCDSAGESAEHCACPDCWYNKTKCNAGQGCMDDGVCDKGEGCFCADCAAEPECADYCVSCRAFTNFFTTPDALCQDGAPSSATLWADLKDCGCTGVCTTECSVTLCNDIAPSLDCIQCLEDTCPQARDACMNDVRPHTYCNPLEAQPCKVANAVCDVYRLGNKLALDAPELVTGFECYLRTTDPELCEACDYTQGSGYCPKNLTCVDGAGLSVDQGVCGKLCCSDGDCGDGGTCVRGGFDAVSSDLGTCDTSPVGQGGAGGSTTPGCEASATPSNGSCVDVAIP